MESHQKPVQVSKQTTRAGMAFAPADDSRIVWADGLGPGVRAFTTTRLGGDSKPPFDTLNLGAHVGDDPEAVQSNRLSLADVLPEQPVWLNQVHGINVLQADDVRSDPAPVTADAAITARSRQVLAILTADCLPVVLVDRQNDVLGVAHAGWRGLAAGVLARTVEAMASRTNGQQTIRAWIGPCIGPDAFQIGPEVREAFLAIDLKLGRFFRRDITQPGKWLADLPGIARSQLLQLGACDVHWCGLCTVNDPESRFFSYRREGQTGRIATLAWFDK